MERANLRGCMIVFISPAFSKWVLPAGNWWRSGRRSQSRAHTPYVLSLWIDDPGRIKCQLFPANMYARRTAGCEVDALAVLMPRRTLCGKDIFRLRYPHRPSTAAISAKVPLLQGITQNYTGLISSPLDWVGTIFDPTTILRWKGKIVLIQYPYKYFKFGNIYWENKSPFVVNHLYKHYVQY